MLRARPIYTLYVFNTKSIFSSIAGRRPDDLRRTIRSTHVGLKLLNLNEKKNDFINQHKLREIKTNTTTLLDTFFNTTHRRAQAGEAAQPVPNPFKRFVYTARSASARESDLGLL